MLRVYLILPCYHEFVNSKNYEKLHTPFGRAVLNLTKISKNILKTWWAEQSIDYFERLVENYKDVVMHILRFKFAKNNSNSSDIELPSVNYEPNLEAALKMLEILFDINMNQRKERLSYEKFYLPDITEMVNLQKDFYRWSQGHVSTLSNSSLIYNRCFSIEIFSFMLFFLIFSYSVQRILPLHLSIYI